MSRLALLVLPLLASLAHAAPVPGEPLVSTKAAPVATLRIAPAAAATVTREIRLAPVAAGELEILRAQREGLQAKRLQIGIGRSLEGSEGAPPSSGNLSWVAVPGGHAARFTLTSPGASALRLGLDLSRAPEGLEIVAFGSARPATLAGPERASRMPDRANTWWSPVTEGESQTLEAFIPQGSDPAASGIRLVQASHLVVSPTDTTAKLATKIGESGSCNIDANCVTTPSQAYLNAKNSVARMTFVDGGGSFLCTGTLLNDTDTTNQIPWFASANHCFDAENPPFRTFAQKQQIANTLATFWFYESPSCGVVSLSPSNVQLTGGATILVADYPSDFLFVRLNSAPPAGAYFSGWDPAPVPANLDVLGIHHPQGDLKKVSQGSATGLSTTAGGLRPDASANAYLRINWSAGTTEGGSSGSAIFSFDSGFGEYFYRGGLLGGQALCSSPDLPDYYSRFDYTFPAVASSLAPGTAPFTNVSALWYDPSQSGWGVKLMQHASNKVFGLWFTYRPDGRAMWYSMPDGAWISSTSYTGPLYEVSGPTPVGAFNPALIDVRLVGSATATFTGANSGTWSYNVRGVMGSKPFTRFQF